MKLIWATRGRHWGFRFLQRGGFDDPLPEYESAFAGFEDSPEVCAKVGDRVALRFPDPQGRKDLAGRVIPHDFVVYPPLAEQVNSIADGIELVWMLPEVNEAFDEVWAMSKSRAGRKFDIGH